LSLAGGRVGLVEGRVGEPGESPVKLRASLSVGICEVESVLLWPLRGVSFPGVRGGRKGLPKFSFCFGDTRDSGCASLRRIELGLIGILDKDGRLGVALKRSAVCFMFVRGCRGSSSSNDADAMRLFRSDNELRRFFLPPFTLLASCSCSGSPIVASL